MPTIIHDGAAILAAGETERAAWVDFNDWLSGKRFDFDETRYGAAPATERLVEMVKSWGGDCAWKMRDGVADIVEG